jgi:hypothetical protein
MFAWSMFVTSLFGNTNFDALSEFQGGTSNAAAVARCGGDARRRDVDPNPFDEEGT